jgi:hypothetical protein
MAGKEGDMNARQIGLGIVLVDFAALNAWVVYRFGMVGFWELATANLAVIAVMVDLTIALTLVSIWMWRDARERGLGFVPYFVVTCLFGSVGPLLYLIRREGSVGGPVGAVRRARATHA